jgi:acyl-CoA hydrolase
MWNIVPVNVCMRWTAICANCVTASMCDLPRPLGPHLCVRAQGCLLRWLDLATCACAEQHTRAHCVTASVCDLQFGDLLSTTGVGFLVTVSATPVKAGNTSLDVYVTATVEDPNAGKINTVCSAFFTYVTLKGPDGVRPKVPKLEDNGTDDEWLSFVAGERRRLAPAMSTVLQQHSTVPESGSRKWSVGDEVDEGTGQCSLSSVVSTSETKVEMLELCLPTNLNHMSHTFGGEVMRWMMKAALVCVSRHLGRSVRNLRGTSGQGGSGQGGAGRAAFRAVAIDNVQFIGPSDSSDHIIFRSSVGGANVWVGQGVSCVKSVVQK